MSEPARPDPGEAAWSEARPGPSLISTSSPSTLTIAAGGGHRRDRSAPARLPGALDRGRWWSGLDIGRLPLHLQRRSTHALSAKSPALPALLADDHWYHTLDKAYGGRALIDPDGLAAGLVGWFTAHRFTPKVVS